MKRTAEHTALLTRKSNAQQRIKLIHAQNVRTADAAWRWANPEKVLLAHGIYILTGGITDNVVRGAREQLLIWSAINPEKPLTVIVNNIGGEVAAGLSFYDLLRKLSFNGHKVTTKIRGQASSIALVIAKAGDEIYISPNSYILIHETSCHYSSRMGPTTAADETEELRQQTAMVFEIIASGSVFTASDLIAKVRATDVWLSAAQTVKDGFGHAIG
jgi:ATP-dependent protease ClpP protease subunit